MIFERLDLAPRIVIAATIALVILAGLEVIAYFGYDESSSTRNAFGYAADSGIAIGDGLVRIEPTSSRRFWPQIYPLKAPTVRIILIGDSALRGGSLNTSLSESLRSALEAQCGVRAEVWNLASPGYGSQRKAVLVHKALEFHPDLIVYHANVTTEYEDEREWTRRVEYQSWHPRHWIDQLPFLGRARLAKLERGYWALLPADVRTEGRSAMEERIAALASKQDAAYWMPRMLDNLDRTVEEIRASRTPLIILSHVLYDFQAAAMTDFGLDAGLQSRYGSLPGVAVMSNRRFFASQPNPALLFADASHWTDSGRDLVADEIAVPAARLLRDPRRCRVAEVASANSP